MRKKCIKKRSLWSSNRYKFDVLNTSNTNIIFVFMAFIVQTTVVFWVFIPCNVFGLFRRFGWAYYLQLQGEWFGFRWQHSHDPKSGRNKLIQQHGATINWSWQKLVRSVILRLPVTFYSSPTSVSGPLTCGATVPLKDLHWNSYVQKRKRPVTEICNAWQTTINYRDCYCPSSHFNGCRRSCRIS